MQFSRTYSTAISPEVTVDGPLGHGWTYNYGMNLTIAVDLSTVTVTQEHGGQVTFTLVGGVYTAPPRVMATLAVSGGTWTFVRGGVETFKFNSSGKLTKQIDLNGHETTLVYTSGKLTSVTDPAGRVLTIGWTSSHITAVTDSASPARSVTFSYTNNNLLEATNVAGETWKFSYDGSHRMVTMRAPQFYSDTTTSPTPVVTNHYDGSGRVDWQSDPLGRTTTFDYTTVPGSTIITDGEYRERQDTFENGLLVAQTFGTGLPAMTWEYTYDPATLGTTSIRDGLGNTTTSTYDTAGNVTSTTDPDGRRTLMTYNTRSQLLTVTTFPDLAAPTVGVTTTNVYDADGNLTSTSTLGTTPPGARTTTYTIATGAGVEGDVTKVTDPDGKEWPRSYDTDGNLITATDPVSNVTRTCYDTVGRATKVIAPKGSAAGVTCATGSPTYTTTMTTDAFGSPLVVTDPLGHATTTVYDDNHRVQRVTDANGEVSEFTYSPADELLQTTRFNTATPATLFSDDFTGTSGAVWNATKWYQTTNDATKVVDLNGSNQGRLRAITSSARATAKTMTPVYNSDVVMSYKFEDNTAQSYFRVLLRGSGATGNTPMTDGYRLEQRNDSATIKLQKYVAGTSTEIGSFTSPGGVTTALRKLRFQVMGGRIRIKTWADGSGEPTTWNLEKYDTVVTAPGILQISNAFSTGAHNVLVDDLVVTDPGSSQQSAYDDAGALTASTDAAGNRTTQGYDAMGRVGGVTDPLGRTTSYWYDLAGRVTTKIDPDFTPGCTGDFIVGCTQYGYNGSGQLAWIDYQQTPHTSDVDYTYDGVGRRIAMTDGTGTSSWTWDSLGRMTWEQNGAGQTTSYGYDLRGNNTSIVYPGGAGTVTRAFDNASRLWKITDWASRQTVFTYDANSFMTGQAYPAANGNTATTDPDAANRQMEIRHAPTGSPASPWAKFTYGRDNTNRLTSVTTTSTSTPAIPADTHTYNYTGLDQLQKVDSTTTWAYDPAANITAQTGGKTLTYDAAQQPLSMVQAGTTTTFGYDTHGNRTSAKVGSASPTGYAYDGENRLLPPYVGADRYVEAVKADAPIGYWRLAETSGTTATNAYGPGPNGTYTGGVTLNQTSAVTTTTDKAAAFNGTTGYVDLGNDTDLTKPVFSIESWFKTSSAADNMIYRWRYYGAYLKVTGGAVKGGYYDSVGTEYSATSPSTSYANNAWHHAVLTYDGSTLRVYVDGAEVATSAAAPDPYYNPGGGADGAAIGRDGTASSSYFNGTLDDVAYYEEPLAADRVKKHYDAAYQSTNSYTYNGDDLRTAKTVSGTTTAFTWSTASALPLLLVDGTTKYIYGPGGLPLEQITSAGVVTYYHHDQLGSTRALTNSTGGVVATYTYDPYGKVTATGGSATNPFQYAGQYTDTETGFQYLRARYYDPNTAQFLTRDPLEPTTGTPYAYTAGNPLNATDPTGQIPWWVIPTLYFLLEAGTATIDALSAANAFADPCASNFDKMVSGGLFGLSFILPGGGYSTGTRGMQRMRNRLGDFADEAGAVGGRALRLTNDQAADMANRLGFRSHGNWRIKNQQVFTDGKRYIVQDIDVHNPNGLWKMAGRPQDLVNKKTRMGTYDYDLNRIGN